MGPQPKTRGCLWRRRLGILFLMLSFLVLASLDWQRRRAPHAGYCPRASTWIFHAADFPHAWQALESMPGPAAARGELADMRRAAERTFHGRTGIRPTPIRWRLWLGNQFLAGRYQGTWGVCIRPGLLLPLADALVGRPAPELGAPELREYRGLVYAWRDGFCLVSPSPSYVVAALKAPAPAPMNPAGRRQIQVWAPSPGHAQGQSAALQAAVDIQPEFPCTVRLPVRPRESARLLPNGSAQWPDPPVLEVAVADGELLGLLRDYALEQAAPDSALGQGLAMMAPVWKAWPVAGQLAAEAGPNRAVSAALLGIDDAAGMPLPTLAWALERFEGEQVHPLQPLVAPWDALPFSWQGESGWLLPLAGQSFTLCLGPAPRYWIAASRESAMADLAGRLEPRTQTRGAAALIRLDWQSAAEALDPVLRWLSAHQLHERGKARDLPRESAPLRAAMARMGTAELWGRPGAAWFEFRGRLAMQRSRADASRDDEAAP